MKRFLTLVITEVNPVLGCSARTQEYYARVFSSFIMPRVCYTYWDIRNDCVAYEHWPETLKMDKFLERCWVDNYENDAVADFLYH